MKLQISLPSKQESIVALSVIAVFIAVTAIFVGIRPEHVAMVILYLFLFFFSKTTRKLAVGLLPFIIFGISYDWMRIYPNYKVNPIDVVGLYNLEKSLFGVHTDGTVITPCEFFSLHHCKIADFLSGIFYLGWVPIPVGFAIYLYLKKDKNIFLRFSMVFLLVNLLGFIIYYIHPAAPPWYAMKYGFTPILDTPGDMAGLERFDQLTGLPIFSSIYGRNANVFAAVPSLHSAYLVVVLFYAIVKKCNIALIAVITVFLFGIWFTAIYTAHHYIVDVILGVLCAITGIALFEAILMKTGWFGHFFGKYLDYIR